MSSVWDEIRLSGKYWFLHPIFQNFWINDALLMNWTKRNVANIFPNPEINQSKTKYLDNQPIIPIIHKRLKGKNKINNTKLPPKSFNEPNKKLHNSNGSMAQKQIMNEKIILNDNINTDEAVEFAVNQTWLEYSEIHSQHVKQREKEKKHIPSNHKKSGELEFPNSEFIDVLEINPYYKNFAPTSERTGKAPLEMRQERLKTLYGSKNAQTIAYMETAMQNAFETLCQTNNPSLWPNIPFRL